MTEGKLKFRAAIGLSAALWACSTVAMPSGPASWGQEPHPAVVGEIGAEYGEYRMSLNGEWDFIAVTATTPHRNAVWGDQYVLKADGWPGATKGLVWEGSDRSRVRKIQVPGPWQTQGVGESGPTKGWACTWDGGKGWLKHAFDGEGWYRRYVEIPKSWAGRRIWLKVGGVMSQGWFWVNNRQVAWYDSYCGTYKYDVTDFVKPGEKAKFDIQASSAVPCRKGNFVGGVHWGGVVRPLELEATPAAWIDDAWARGDFDRRAADVRATVLGDVPAGARVEVTVTPAAGGAAAKGGAAVAKGGETRVSVPLADFRPWTPEMPNLYWAEIRLTADGKTLMTRRERFGMKKLEVRGKEFYLNGKPFYMRGVGYHKVYPDVGFPLRTRELYRKDFALVKASGFNVIRTHTSCEFPEAYEAADEVGVIVQGELPYYTDTPTDPFTFDPLGDARELYEHYRRYASFGIYSGGNEGEFGRQLGIRLRNLVHGLDPDRLFLEQDGVATAPERSDFDSKYTRPWPCGEYDPPAPFVAHEYLNLGVKCDERARCSRKTPAERAARMDEVGRWMETNGLDRAWYDRFQDGENALQAWWSKQGIESARADPYCDGYSFWSFLDVMGSYESKKGLMPIKFYSAQALFDPYRQPKRKGHTAESFRVFNGPVALVWVTSAGGDIRSAYGFAASNRVFTAGEKVASSFVLSHYGEKPVRRPTLAWKIEAEGRVLASGAVKTPDQPLGPARTVAAFDLEMPSVAKPLKARLAVTLSGEGDSAANAWDLWIFPKRAPKAVAGVAASDAIRAKLARRFTGLLPLADAARAKTVLTEDGDKGVPLYLAAGKNVVTFGDGDGDFPGEEKFRYVSPGWWSIPKQSGVIFLDSPILRYLPHSGGLDPVAFRLLRFGKRLPVAGVTPADIVIAGEGRDRAFLYLADVRQPKGNRHVRVYAMDLLEDIPEATAVMDGLFESLER